MIGEYRVRQRGCSLTHSARTPPAVHPGITIWVEKIEIDKKKGKKRRKKIGSGIFLGEGGKFFSNFLSHFFVFRRN